MQSERSSRNIGREKLRRIIEVCTSLEGHSLDPFTLEINEAIEVLKKYFPDWQETEDLCLDAETISHLATVIELQSDWVEHRTSSLYTDPFLLEKKLNRIRKGDISNIFLKIWTPTVELEKISIPSLKEAMNYWRRLLPLDERWREPLYDEVVSKTVSLRELVQERILSDKAFSEELHELWRALKSETEERGKEGKIEYWDFVGSEDYQTTVYRAFMTSFLVTYGYATLVIHPLEEEIFVKVHEEPFTKVGEKQLISIPITVTFEDWLRWKEENRGE